MRMKSRLKKAMFSHQGLLVMITIITYLVFFLVSPNFAKITNLYTILRTMCIVSILALGVTFVITLGEIDLSIETLPGLCAAVFCYLIEAKAAFLSALLAALACCLLVGLINGLVIVKTKLPSIVITLATGMIVGGLTEIVTAHRAIVISLKSFTDLINFRIGNFPGIAIWMLLFVVIAYIIMHKTKLGRYLELTGDNREASRYAGLNDRLYYLIAFLICATFCFLGGMMGVSISSNATPDMLRNYQMTAITATVIGGTNMNGGKASILGTIIGAFFLSTVENGFLIVGIQQWVLYLVNGVVIMLTLALKETLQHSRGIQ